MKVTVLGKYGPYPKAGGATSSYLVQCGGKNVLMDAGDGCLSRLQKYISLNEIDLILLSHLHYDHCCDMFILRYVPGDPIKTYLPASPAEQFGGIHAVPRFDATPISEGAILHEGDIEVSFCRVEHPVECYAMKIKADGKTLVYSGDSVYISRLAEFAVGADTLLIDSGFTGPVDESANKPHMYVSQAAQIAKDAGVRQLLLSHIVPPFDEALVLSEAQAIFPAAIVVVEETAYTV